MFLSESSFPITEKLGHQKYRHLFKKKQNKKSIDGSRNPAFSMKELWLWCLGLHPNLIFTVLFLSWQVTRGMVHTHLQVDAWSVTTETLGITAWITEQI